MQVGSTARSMPMRISARSSWLRLRSGLLRLNRGVGQTIAALNQFFQSLGEARRRDPVDDIVIKADRQAQRVPHSYVPINENRLLTNAAHCLR